MRRDGTSAVEYNRFLGYNTSDEPSVLPQGYMVAGSHDIDVTRYLGSLAKRRGTDGMITSLGVGGGKGFHNYRHSGGDIPLFGWGTNCYKLHATAATLVKTTKADFDAGTKTNIDTITTVNSMKTLDEATHTQDQITTGGGAYTTYFLTPASPVGQTFTPGAGITNLTRVSFSPLFYYALIQWDLGEEVTLTVYSVDPAALPNISTTGTLGTKTLDYSHKSQTFEFDDPIAVTAGTVYYLELTLNTGTLYQNIYAYTVGTYAGGSLYTGAARTQQTGEDLVMSTYYHPCATSATWTSPVYDLASKPTSASLAFTQTTPAGTAVSWYGQASDDNATWGDWALVAASTNAIPRGRYVKIKAAFTGTTVATATVTDFTISYSGAFDSATSIKGSLSGTRIRFDDYDGTAYFAEGGQPQRYNPTYTTGDPYYGPEGNVGYTTLPTAPTVATGAAGLPNGTYYCKVTFVNHYGEESNGGTASASVSPALQKIAWSAIPVGAAGTFTASRKLYRTKAGTTTPYYYVATVADNTTTTYTDNTDDAALVTELVATNNAPPISSIVYEHKAYMMYVYQTDKKLLYFSKVGLPGNVPTTQYKEFPADILGVHTFEDALVVGGKTFTHVVFGSIWGGSDNTNIKTVSSGIGPVSHEALCECFSPDLGNILVIVSEKGVAYLTPGLQENTLRSLTLSKEVQSVFNNAVDRDKVSAYYFDSCLRIAMRSNIDGAIRDIEMVYSFISGKWNTPYYRGFSGYCESDNILYAVSSSIGQVYQIETGASDDGSNISALAKMAPLYFPQKMRFISATVYVAEGSDTGAMWLRVKSDGVEGAVAVGKVSMWNDGLRSSPIRLPVPRGQKLEIIVVDDSAKDWVIEKIVIEYERGE